MAIATYSPKDVKVVVGAAPMVGFADGSFVDVEYNEEAFKPFTGVDGKHARTKNAKKITSKLLFNRGKKHNFSNKQSNNIHFSY
jgi:hypothetical protein